MEVRAWLAWVACAASCATGYDDLCEDGGPCDADSGDTPTLCGDGVCSAPEETAANCPDDCSACALLEDITSLINGDLYIGYSSLGTARLTPDCGALGDAREVLLSLTPEVDGMLVFSTRHPTTGFETVLEVREDDCDGPALGCNDLITAGVPGSRLTVNLEAGTRYIALVETSDDDEGVFALGVHRPGVCEGLGTVVDATPLLPGGRNSSDTSASTSSLRGIDCATAAGGPEVLYRFTAPREGTLVATTVHPATTIDTVLHVREGEVDGSEWCDSPEAELGCSDGEAPGDLGTLLRFGVFAGVPYDLFVDGPGESPGGPFTLTLGYASTSPVRQELHGCDHYVVVDEFAFFALGGQTVSLKVDTVDAATAADSRLRVHLPDGSVLHEADDEVACSFAPPAYSCPQYSFTAATSGLYSVQVTVGASERCYNSGLANYAITVDVGGAPSELIVIRDQ